MEECCFGSAACVTLAASRVASQDTKLTLWLLDTLRDPSAAGQTVDTSAQETLRAFCLKFSVQNFADFGVDRIGSKFAEICKANFARSAGLYVQHSIRMQNL